MKAKKISLSINKQVNDRNLTLDCEIRTSMKSLGLKSMLNRANIKKQKGFLTFHLFYLIILLPFIQKTITFFVSKDCYLNQANAKKDTFYRFLNNESFNWRKLVLLLAQKVISKCGDVPLSQKVLIADDTIVQKTGKKMEMVSYHFDHAKKRNVLGYQFLQLVFHNGINLFPIAVSQHTSSKQPNNKRRDRQKDNWLEKQS